MFHSLTTKQIPSCFRLLITGVFYCILFRNFHEKKMDVQTVGKQHSFTGRTSQVLAASLLEYLVKRKGGRQMKMSTTLSNAAKIFSGPGNPKSKHNFPHCRKKKGKRELVQLLGGVAMPRAPEFQTLLLPLYSSEKFQLLD